MFKFIRKYQKQILAVFSVGLMIQFVVSTGTGRGAGNRRNDTAIGKIGGKTLYASELEQSRREWGALNHYLQSPMADPRTGRPEPFTYYAFGPDVATAIDQKPELFMLLRHEARQAGVRAPQDEIESILVNWRPNKGDDDAVEDLVRDAVTDVVLIQANFNRLAGDIKVSAPMREKVLAKVLQTIQLKAVELSAADYLNKVPAPTTQQVQEQFAKYADVAPPEQLDPQNPFGFGYRLPDRVKVQYITIDRAQAEKTVEKRMSAYDWDVQARLYYRTHKEDFPSTQPTPPTTQSLTAGPAATQPSTAPAYRPYEQVADEALHAVRDPMVDKLMFDVASKITSTMTADWRAFSQPPTAAAGAAPITSGASGYRSYGYLKNLTDAVQKQFDVTVYLSDYDRYQSEKELATLPGIGQASDGPIARGGHTFASLAMNRATIYLARSDKNAPAAQAQLMQPVGPLADGLRNLYLFRITDAQPAEPAKSLDEVRPKVELDLKTIAAYDLAQNAAKPLLEAARAGNIAAAATAVGKRAITTSPFNSNPYSAQPPDLGPDITPSPQGRKDFAEQAFTLLAQYDPSTNPNPAKLITLPEDAKVYVAQLIKVTPAWDAATFYSTDLSVTAQVRQLMAQDLRNDWFSYDSAAKRLAYEPPAGQKAAVAND